MEKILSVIVDGLIFIVMLLLLIGFHELGHLLAGKLARVPIEKFSIGFGPAIVKWKAGSTTYQLSVLPLGGYVKFKGEDFDDPEGFYAYPYWRKSVATVGGVIFNLFLAVIAYLLMGLIFGVATPTATLDFPADSPLAEAGFVVGDSVVSVNNEEVTSFAEFFAYSSAKDSLDIEVARPEKRLVIAVPPSDPAASLVVPRSLKLDETLDTQLTRAGLQAGDSIVTIEGVEVTSVYELSALFPNTDTLRLRVVRPAELISLRTSGEAISSGEPLYGPVVGRVIKRTPAENAGIEKGDRILEADGKPINFWNDFAEVITTVDTATSVEIVWLHLEDTVRASIKPVEIRFFADRYTGIGVISYSPYRPVTFGEALWLPVKRTGQVTALIVLALGKLIRRPKEIKGLISIARYTSQLRRWGFDFLLGMFASLSVTLAIINLLPIPALDGGRILMFTIEKIRRRRFGKKAWTIALNIGFILVIALIVWTLVSDIFFPS